jgi:hypothetical protein
MRTFPKQLATLRNVVESRCEELKRRPYDDLRQLSVPTDQLEIEGRPTTIHIIVEPRSNDAVMVVVQGFMKARLLGHNVAVEGFYKYPDETTADLSTEDYYRYD